MLKLTSLQSEPFWLDILPANLIAGAKGKKAETVAAQRTQFRPVTMSMILVARQEAAKALLTAIPKHATATDADKSLMDAKGRVAFVVAMAQLGIVAWEGVGGPDGEEIAPTPESIGAYLSDWRVFDAVDKLYVQPALARADEKNASAPSRTGTSGARTRAKGSAGTARKSVKSVPTA